MDEYLRCIYAYIEENLLYGEARKRRDYREAMLRHEIQCNRMKAQCGKEQWRQFNRCCDDCIAAQSVVNQILFEQGVAVGKYFSK